MSGFAETVPIYVVSRLIASSNPYTIVEFSLAVPFVLLVIDTDYDANSLRQGLRRLLTYNLYTSKLILNMFLKSLSKHSN